MSGAEEDKDDEDTVFAVDEVSDNGVGGAKGSTGIKKAIVTFKEFVDVRFKNI